MGLNGIKHIYAGAYVEIKKTPKEVDDFFERQERQLGEGYWEFIERLGFRNVENIESNILLPDSTEFILPTKINSNTAVYCCDKMLSTYLSSITELNNLFGEENIEIYVGAVTYLDEID